MAGVNANEASARAHGGAETGPALRRTGRELGAALAGIPAPDDAFSDEIALAVAYLAVEDRDHHERPRA